MVLLPCDLHLPAWTGRHSCILLETWLIAVLSSRRAGKLVSMSVLCVLLETWLIAVLSSRQAGKLVSMSVPCVLFETWLIALLCLLVRQGNWSQC